jgi:hypothetical protein
MMKADRGRGAVGADLFEDPHRHPEADPRQFAADRVGKANVASIVQAVLPAAAATEPAERAVRAPAASIQAVVAPSLALREPDG